MEIDGHFGDRHPLNPPLRIQVVSDGRAGMENQALGLAEAVQRLIPADITVKRIGWKRPFDRLPSLLKRDWMLDRRRDDPFPPPGEAWPDLWIATGRATLPLSIAARRRSEGRTFVVQTQHPRLSPSRFDMVVAPAHDFLSGDAVFEIIGSPHRIRREALAQGAEAAFAEGLSALPHPRVAVMIGGRSAAFDLTPEHAASLADQIAETIEAARGSLMLTFSRRTPPQAQAIMTQRLGGLPGQIWDGQGANPLFAFLHYADHILVTEDSANMATEAAATGRPVHILPMVARKTARKFQHLHEDLANLGATRPFDGRLESWAYTPLDETDRAARAILEALSVRPSR